MAAAMIVEEGRVRAATAKRNCGVCPGTTTARQSAPGDRGVPCQRQRGPRGHGWDLCRREVSLMELPRFEGLVFIRALRFCLAGDLSDRAEVCRIAKAIWRRVAVSRGPKLTHASAAHEYFLESQSVFEDAAFTWSPDSEDFTDRLTQATREEFDDPDFNPVPGAATAASQTGLRRVVRTSAIPLVRGAVFLDPRN